MNLTEQTPQQIDTHLSGIYQRYAKTLTQWAAAERTATKLLKDLADAYTEYDIQHAQSRVNRFLGPERAKAERAKAEMDAIAREMEPFNTEFERRGGWNRAFLVRGAGGHIHRSMECSTCRPSTTFTWMPEHSGNDESTIVEAAGEMACTVCYPTAPVGA